MGSTTKRTVRRKGDGPSLYREEVAAFISECGGEIADVQKRRILALWDFEIDMTPENEKELNARQEEERSLGRNIEKLATAKRLRESSRFSRLSRVNRRALEDIIAFLESFMPPAAVRAECAQLQQAIDEQQTALTRMYSSVANIGDLLRSPTASSDGSFADRLRDLVMERNLLAQQRGFDNYYRMRIQEESGDFDALRNVIDQLISALDEIDARVEKLPTMRLFAYVHLRRARAEPGEILERTGNLLGIKLDAIADVLLKSDVYPRAGKNRHVMVFPIDPPYDVRAHLNIPDELELTWKVIRAQLLHEVIGHSVDFASIDPELPATLRGHSSFSTEVMAVLSEQLVFEPKWLQAVYGLSPALLRLEAASRTSWQLRSMLSELRWYLVKVSFEIALYEDPLQDLDRRYSELIAWAEQIPVERALAFHGRGAWSIEIMHYLQHPVYVHNYLLGTLWAMQLRVSLRKRFGSFTSKRIGPFLAKHRRFGLLYSDDELIKRITGSAFDPAVAINELRRQVSLLEAQHQSKAA